MEVDSTFYHCPAVSTVEGCARKTPADFIFSVKVVVNHESEIGDGGRFVSVQGKRFDFRKIQREFGPVLVVDAENVRPGDFEILAFG